MKWLLILAALCVALIYFFGKELAGTSAPEGTSGGQLEEFENRQKPPKRGKEPSTPQD
jgi:hypothetical protein